MNTTFRNSSSAPRHLHRAAIVGTLLATLCASAPTIAQTCVAPGTLPPTPVAVTGSTCGGEQLGTLCGGLADNPGPNHVLQFVLHNPSGHLLISGDSSFTPVMYLAMTSGSCEDAECLAIGDIANGMALDGLPPGHYRLIIAAPPNAPANTCGSFSLIGDDAFYAGEADVIFQDGFDF